MESDGEQGEQRAGRERSDHTSARTAYDEMTPLEPPHLGQAASGAGQSGSQSATEIADEVLPDDDPRPTVEHRAWLKKDDYWQRTTYIALTGRHTSALPRARRLPPPRRFGRPRPVRSGLALALVIALIILIPFGIAAAQRAVSRIHVSTHIPGITLPTPSHTVTPTVTVKPTSTPQKKK